MTASFRLVAIDVDGTLLDSEYQLASSAEAAVETARRAELMVSLVSGRPRCGILEYLEHLDLNAPDITSGGAFIYDPQRSRVILDDRIPRETAHQIILKARQAGVAIFSEAPYEIQFEAASDILERTPTVGKDFMVRSQDLLKEPDLQPNKITMIGDPEILKQLDEELRELDQPIHLTSSGARFLEANRQGVNKGHALIKLADYLDIQPSSILAIGDNHNDVSMFKVAGFSVAMGNAPQEVQAKVDLIAPTNDDHGLLWTLERLAKNSFPFDKWTP
jgi:Cof subfamily protein (haloacid dehalogenase superfamily)